MGDKNGQERLNEMIIDFSFSILQNLLAVARYVSMLIQLDTCWLMKKVLVSSSTKEFHLCLKI